MGTGRVGAAGAGSTYAAGSDNYYPVAVVQAGQNTLAQVADSLRKQGVSVDMETLQKLNPHITDSTRLQPGQEIRLPLAAGENLPMIEGGSEPPATASPTGAPTLPSDDPTNKAIVQSQLAYGAQTAGGVTQGTAAQTRRSDRAGQQERRNRSQESRAGAPEGC